MSLNPKYTAKKWRGISGEENTHPPRRKIGNENPNNDYLEEFRELRMKMNADIANRMEIFVKLSPEKPSVEDLIQLVRNIT